MEEKGEKKGDDGSSLASSIQNYPVEVNINNHFIPLTICYLEEHKNIQQ